MAERRYAHSLVAALVKLSSGMCYWPGCGQPIVVLVNNEPSFNYQIAHIRALHPKGARYDEKMTDRERNAFANLILLCRPHHDYVDRMHPEQFSVAKLHGWKRDAESSDIAKALSDLPALDDTQLIETIRTAMDQQVTDVKIVLADLEKSHAESATLVRALVSRLDDYQLVGNYVDASKVSMLNEAAGLISESLNPTIMRELSDLTSQIGLLTTRGYLDDLRFIVHEMGRLGRG